MRRVVAILVVALGLTLVPGVAPSSPSAEAAPSDIVAVVVEGTGFGHGRGMSQWGAYGWAVDQGKSWQWILDHYYGGTRLSTVNTAQTRIRVDLVDLRGLGTVGVTTGNGSVSAAGETARSLYAREVSPNRFEIYSTGSMACPSASTLVVPDGRIARGSTNRTAVRQIQTFLNAFRIPGDITLTVDGAFGPLTESRLRDWQGDQRLPVDGVWDTTPDAARARQQIASGAGSTAWTYERTVTGPVTFTTANGENSAAAPASVLGVCDAGGAVTHYRGRIEVRSESVGNRVVNDVKTEDYLRGVVPKEISASWADAGGGRGANAVRAQAVAARSYGLQQNRYGYASICDTQSCQVYFGAASRPRATAAPTIVEDRRTDAAIAATAGKVRTFPSGAIASTEFSASNGPRTAGGVFPAVDDGPGDGTDRNPNHRWTRVLDADTLAARYGLGSITSASMVEAASSTYRQFDGDWFNDIVLTGSNGRTFRQQAWDFRRANGLPSPGFTVRVVREDTTTRSVSFIGDSVGRSVAAYSNSELRILTDGTFPSQRYDTVTGRCTVTVSCPGTSGVQAAAGVARGTDLVVVQLGYNDWPPSFAGHIDQMMAALAARQVRQVAWVNLAELRTSGSGSYYAASNAALRAAERRYPNLTVLDWNAASNTPERPRWFADDVHLTSTGQAEFAGWLREEMVRLAPPARLTPQRRIELPVVGETFRLSGGGTAVVPEDAVAVSMNVAAVRPDGFGNVRVFPCADQPPGTSTVNFPAATRSNNVIAPVGPDGTVCFVTSTATDLVVDMNGWFTDDLPTAPVAVTPERIVSTRDGIGTARRKLRPGVPIRVPLAGRSVSFPDGGNGTVPASFAAAAINLTTVRAEGIGNVVVWPCGTPKPLASSLNFVPGAALANGVVAVPDASGTLCVQASTTTDVIIDLMGWFPSASGPGELTGSVPERLVDSRIGLGAARGKVAPRTTIRVPVVGRSVTVDGVRTTVPASAGAAAVYLTAVRPDGAGNVTLWSCEGAAPTAVNLNFLGVTIGNSALVPLNDAGELCIVVRTRTHVTLDITGWIDDDGGSSFVPAASTRVVDTRSGIGPLPR